MLAGVTNMCLKKTANMLRLSKQAWSVDRQRWSSVQMHAISTRCTTVSLFQKEQHMLILNDEPGGLHAPLKV
jgi:hypothetical protein